MTEKPIIFSAPMVRAILDGRKSMTRRIVKPQPEYRESKSLLGHYATWAKGWNIDDPIGLKAFVDGCPYGGPGDRLLVSSYIPVIPNTYCAGSDGNIYSKARGGWKQLKAFRNGKGYEVVTTMDGGKKRTRNVHRLVCAAFYGPPPTSSSQVRHLDGNPEHGSPENLAWGDQYDNWQDRKAHGNGCEGEKHHCAKFTDAERAHIRWAIEHDLCSQRHAARILGVTQASIYELMRANELTAPTIADPGPRIPRITLEIVSVRVERVREISGPDCIAEGVNKLSRVDDGPPLGGNPWREQKAAFRSLWQSINGPGSWDLNPYVWAISFKVVP